jgi:AcrR family transcriptional regulator
MATGHTPFGKEQTTKEKIMDAALTLFTHHGFSDVPMRAIAKAVGINAASIYNHFASKEEILYSLYDFYKERRLGAAPDTNELMKAVETLPPFEALMKLDFHFDPAIQEKMDRILVVASRRISSDPISERFVRENIFEHGAALLIPMLGRMIDLGKIEPLNVKAFVILMNHYAYSAAALNNSPLKISLEDWRLGMGVLFSMIRPTGK